MLVRVNWAQPNSDGNSTYHTYEARDYYVEKFEKETPTRFRVVLNVDKEAHELFLGRGDAAYIMNDQGKTIDVVRT